MSGCGCSFTPVENKETEKSNTPMHWQNSLQQKSE